MADIATWVATEGERLLFIYGEYDPWTGGAFDLGDAADSYLFVDPAGNEVARLIGRQTPAALEQALAAAEPPPHELDLLLEVALHARRGDLVASHEALRAEPRSVVALSHLPLLRPRRLGPPSARPGYRGRRCLRCSGRSRT